MAESTFEYTKRFAGPVTDLTQLVDYAVAEHLNAAASALTLEAESIMSASKEIVPVDSGALRASGMVGEPEFGTFRVDVQMGYGGAAASYAIVQHETPTVGPGEPKGPFIGYEHAPGKSDKFLERPLQEAAEGFETRMAARMRRYLDRTA